MMPENLAEQLSDLIKEGEHNCYTFTKQGSEVKIRAESEGLRYLADLGLATPDVVWSAETVLTLKFVNGISVFRAIELLDSRNKEQEVYEILDELCQAVGRIQENASVLQLDFIPYDAERKVAQIADLLKEISPDVATKLVELIPAFVDWYAKASVPFRDATPKNHILQGLEPDDLGDVKGGLADRVIHFDVGTLRFLTFRPDDFYSVLFHYMIGPDMRTALLRKHGVDVNTDESIVAGFVRLGRFWVRREYYRRYKPQAFLKRYADENIEFYELVMREYADKAIDVLSSH